MFTLVTTKTKKKMMMNLVLLSLFLLLFNRIYEHFSYGESSIYMKGMFVIPLFGVLAYSLSFLGRIWLSKRASVLLFNSSLAIAISGCLIKGIIEISGRSTTLDIPYLWTSFAFFVLSGLVCFYPIRKQEDFL